MIRSVLAQKLLVKKLDKGKSFERMRRKATDLRLRYESFSMIAGLPER